MHLTTGTAANQSWNFLQPKSFHPYEWLPANLYHRYDEACCFVNILCRKLPTLEIGEFSRLYSPILRQLIDWRGWPIIDALIASGCVECDNFYEPKTKSYGYRLSKRWLSDHPTLVAPTTARMRGRLDRAAEKFKQDQKACRLPIHDLLHDVQMNDLTIDWNLSEEILATLPEETLFSQRWIVDNIKHHRPFNKVCRMGRWHNGLSGMKRDLRQACFLDGETLWSVDLSCCQPALLAMFLLGKTPILSRVSVATYVGSLREAAVYGEMCADGTLYDEMASRSDTLSRDDVKKRFIVDVFAPKPFEIAGRLCDYPSEIRDIFASMFPSIWKFIQAVNFGKNKHGTLICELQRLEAWLMFQHIAPKALERCPILTVHDAVFCGASNVGIVHEAFEEAFREVGYRMRTKEEDWAPQHHSD